MFVSDRAVHLPCLQVMVPLSLYVTIELVKMGQVYFIQNDKELYHAGSNKTMQCRALNITEDLGQVCPLIGHFHYYLQLFCFHMIC